MTKGGKARGWKVAQLGVAVVKKILYVKKIYNLLSNKHT